MQVERAVGILGVDSRLYTNSLFLDRVVGFVLQGM